jgi:hypothetical protein
LPARPTRRAGLWEKGGEEGGKDGSDDGEIVDDDDVVVVVVVDDDDDDDDDDVDDDVDDHHHHHDDDDYQEPSWECTHVRSPSTRTKKLAGVRIPLRMAMTSFFEVWRAIASCAYAHQHAFVTTTDS